MNISGTPNGVFYSYNSIKVQLLQGQQDLEKSKSDMQEENHVLYGEDSRERQNFIL